VDDIPPKIRDLDRELAELHRRHPVPEMADAAQNMTQQLRIAVHGSTWARPAPPRDVWLGLLAEVIALREERAAAAHGLP
jgi:hypothetical protein